jgi:hypothetical protein
MTANAVKHANMLIMRSLGGSSKFNVQGFKVDGEWFKSFKPFNRYAQFKLFHWALLVPNVPEVPIVPNV